MSTNATGRAQGSAQKLIHDRDDENRSHLSTEDGHEPEFELAEMPALTVEEALDIIEAHGVPWQAVLALVTAAWGRSA
jgi:hypothetical protein